MGKIIGLLGSLVSFVFTLIIGVAVVMALIYGIDWFITGNNAGMAGSTIHESGMSVIEFVTAIFSG